MIKCFHFVLNILFLFELNYVHADIGTISGYPQVDIRDLNALTLSWNQVSVTVFTIIDPKTYISFWFCKVAIHWTIIFHKMILGSLPSPRKFARDWWTTENARRVLQRALWLFWSRNLLKTFKSYGWTTTR